VGTIIGVAEKSKLLSGEPIQPGDRLIGLASSGLHTNGFSLATKLLFTHLRFRVDDRLPGTETQLLDALLEPHLSYLPVIQTLLKKWNKGSNFSQRDGNQLLGAAHITG